MKKYTGKSVYSGVAIGKISVFKRREADVRRVRIDDIEAEKARLEKAKEQSLNQLQAIYEKALKDT